MRIETHQIRERTEDRGVLVTAAEAAECNCPDPCERDHGND
jgi:hypothetical protein